MIENVLEPFLLTILKFQGKSYFATMGPYMKDRIQEAERRAGRGRSRGRSLRGHVDALKYKNEAYCLNYLEISLISFLFCFCL